MPRTLIVHELIPEEIILAVVDLSDDEFKRLSKANGFIINAHPDNEDGHPKFNTALEIDANLNEKGKWFKNRLSNDSPELVAPVEKIINCGFLL